MSTPVNDITAIDSAPGRLEVRLNTSEEAHARRRRAALQRQAASLSHETAPSGFNTKAIRTGHWRTIEGEHSEPIFETSSYVYADCAESEAAFAGQIESNVYSRFTNPTVAVFERRLAALELAEGAVATASGMAGLLAICLTFLEAGDHVVCSRSVFGSTVTLLRNFFVKFGVEVSFVPVSVTAEWERAMRKETALLFCETPSNPLLEIADLRALSRLARPTRALLVVDNTFCTPCGQNPLALGASLVLHSASKYIDGQGRCIGGAIAGSAALISRLRGFMRCAGPALGAHNAWILLKGLETLQLRMERHSSNARTIATWLAGHPRVSAVHYTGLATHPQYALARTQQRQDGGVLSFRIEGGRAEAWRCIDSMQMISKTTNIGDTKSMVTHPASTTHAKLPADERAAAGIDENLIRLTVGLEDVHDIIADLDIGLKSI